MRSKTFAVGSIVVIAGLLAIAGLAQNRIPHQGATAPMAHAAAQNVVTLAGTVTSVNMAPGRGMPSVVLHTPAGDFTVLLGPYRLLTNNKFEIKPGDTAQVKAFQDPQTANAYVATEITVNGSTLVLRDAGGMPHAGGRMGMQQGGRMMGMQHNADGTMQGMRGMHAMHGAGTCAYSAANLDLSALTVLEGAVLSVNLGAGQGMPTFVLTSGGKNLTIAACPYHALVKAGFQISAGDVMSVKAYPITNAAGSYVAAELNNLTTSKSLKLRDESGMPLGMQGDCPMKGNCPYIK
ncbi:MAG: hypothetical protein LAP85_07155 [Acidobacteriia bacterium]|nr:hypothetical protein [Terriglobia bacterium]